MRVVIAFAVGNVAGILSTTVHHGVWYACVLGAIVGLFAKEQSS